MLIGLVSVESSLCRLQKDAIQSIPLPIQLYFFIYLLVLVFPHWSLLLFWYIFAHSFRTLNIFSYMKIFMTIVYDFFFFWCFLISFKGLSFNLPSVCIVLTGTSRIIFSNVGECLNLVAYIVLHK